MCRKNVVMLAVLMLSLWGVANAGIIPGSAITASASSTADGGAQYVVDGSGRYLGPGAGQNYDPSGQYHDCVTYQVTWLSNNRGFADSAFTGTAAGPEWFVIQFDQVYALDQMDVWNYNFYARPDRGMKEVYLDYSADGTGWTRLMHGADNFWTFAQAPGAWQYLSNTAVAFGGAQAKFVVITPKAGAAGQWGASDGYYGLSELAFNGNAVPEPATLLMLGLGSLLLRKKSA